MPVGVHGSGAGRRATSQPRLVGCSPSTSLTGSTRDRIANSSRPGGLLDEERGAGGVGVQLVDDRLDLGLGGRRRAVRAGWLATPISAQSRCLAATYHVAARVVADEHGAEARDDALLAQRGDALVSSALIAASVALPSRGVAVTAPILPR